MVIKALVFDAYGTLYDVHSVIQACETRWPGAGNALSRLWRTKQLEYTWLRSLMGAYADFESVTRDALRHSCAALSLELKGADETALMDRYRTLAAFPDAEAALSALRPMALSILSNGSPGMLEALVSGSSLRPLIGRVLSVDAVRRYKPDPEVYRLATRALSLPPGEIGFVSANCWDACGAKAFGFRVFWVNRAGAPVDELGVAPDQVLTDLRELPTRVAALS